MLDISLGGARSIVHGHLGYRKSGSRWALRTSQMIKNSCMGLAVMCIIRYTNQGEKFVQ